MATVLAFFLIDWVFFTLLTVGVIAIIACLETEHLGWSHTLFVAILVLLAYKMNYSFSDIINKPGVLLQYFAAYIGIGIIWAFAKWYFYLRNILDKFNILKATFPVMFSNPVLKNLENSYEIKSHLTRLQIKIEKKDGVTTLIPPQASENKALITSWITHWPFSMLWTMINDPIKRLINYIFNRIQSLFQAISNGMFSSVNKEFQTIQSNESTEKRKKAERVVD